jgi:hypothetical protein
VVNGTAYDAAPAEFGAPIGLSVSGGLFLVSDGVATVTDACESLPTQVADGKVAIIDRGAARFATKAKNAETAGAVAAIIANNTGTTEIGTMGEGTQHLRVTIPAVMVGRNDGATIKTLVGQVADASRRDPGAHATRRRLDSDIVFHEYCHGLTWRMIGNMSGPMAGAIGEGMSDVCAVLMNNDPLVGEYATSNDVSGIRTASYEGYPRRTRTGPARSALRRRDLRRDRLAHVEELRGGRPARRHAVHVHRRWHEFHAERTDGGADA